MSVNVVVPDIGTEEAAEVVEICVAVGDTIEAEQSIIVLETDKASVEVPSSHAGKVTAILVSEGDAIKTGAAILSVETDSEAEEKTEVAEDNKEEAGSAAEKTETSEKSDDNKKKEKKKEEKKTEEPSKSSSKSTTGSNKSIPVPDLGGASDVDVIEVCVAVGDEIQEGDSLIVLETDKASLDVPAPFSGKILSLAIKEGDKVKEGDIIVEVETGDGQAGNEQTSDEQVEADAESSPESDSASDKTQSPKNDINKSASQSSSVSATASSSPSPQIKSISDKGDTAYAGPAVRKLARQLGVDLSKVKASGPRNRCTKDDVRDYVKNVIAGKSTGEGSGIPSVPAVDFTKFGDVEKIKLAKIKRSTAANMHRSWLNVPHVTQFDDADISDLEAFRNSQKEEAEKRGVKLSPVPFLIKACALALKEEPSFNVSLDPDGQHIYQKQYVNIGMAVDTPAGLVVPVIYDVDKKSIWEIAADVVLVASKARDGKLTPKEMQGGCFTISSLGAIGGQGFTPIVNTPEVGILGVSKAAIKPFWDGKDFVPRDYLPLSLSYDHRAVNGADAGRFLTYLVSVLADHQLLMEGS